MLKERQPGERYRRKPLEADVIILRRGESWDSQGIDISATGLLVLRPDGWTGEDGAEYGIELVLSDGATIAVRGVIRRSDDLGVAFEFTRIPPESEAPLWRLLGAFADATEAPVDPAPADPAL